MSNPCKVPDDGIGALTTLTVTLVFAGASFVLVGAGGSRCCGATRSVRLKFEQRQTEMRQAAAAEVLAAQASKPTTEDIP